MGKKRMTQPSISVPQDNVTKAKTIIEGVTVSVLLYSQFGNLWFVWTIEGVTVSNIYTTAADIKSFNVYTRG